MSHSTSSILLGIDPGTTTGLASICTVTSTILSVGSASPLETVRQLEAWARDEVVAGAVIEDSRELPIYARHGGKNRGERDRVARSVGGVDTLTGLYTDLLRSFGIPVELVEPVRSKKWDAETCARITGWTERSNQHGRDALRLIYRRRAQTAQADVTSAPLSHSLFHSTERGGIPTP